MKKFSHLLWLNLLFSIRGIAYTVCAFLCFQPVAAQEIPYSTTEISAADNPLGLAKQPRQAFLNIGILGGLSVQQDAYHSPLRHVGFTYGAGLRSRTYSRDMLVDITSTYFTGLIVPTAVQPLRPSLFTSGITVLHGNIALALGFVASQSEDRTFRLFAGPLLNAMVHLKISNVFGNSGQALDLHGALGGMARAEKDFTFLGKQWRASSQLNLPLIGFAQRPYYSTRGQSIAANETESTSDFQFVSVFNFPNIKWQTGVEFMLGTGNWLGLEYQWNFYDYTRFQRVQFARHALILSLGVRLE
ncbi:MAG: hypothetical protein ACOVSW_04425 [Candidatus Kapaibacteriota bacterium]